MSGRTLALLAGAALLGGYLLLQSGPNPNPPFKFNVGDRVSQNLSVGGGQDAHGNYIPPIIVTAYGTVTGRHTEKDVGERSVHYDNYYDVQLDIVPGYSGPATVNTIEDNLHKV